VLVFCACAALANTVGDMSRGVVLPDDLAEPMVPSLVCYASGQTMMLLLLGALKWVSVLDFDLVVSIAL
jgi:hypothetical protein